MRDRIIERDQVCRLCAGASYAFLFQRWARDGETREFNGVQIWGDYSVLRLTFEVDHIVAVQDDGTDHPDNLRLLCRPCHARVTAKQRTNKALERYQDGAEAVGQVQLGFDLC